MRNLITIDFIFDADCPNVEPARESLRQACRRLGIRPSWNEWDRGDRATPSHMLPFGSPTILVNGADIDIQVSDAAASCCRLYRAGAGAASGVPPIEVIVAALARAVGGAA